MLTLFSNQPKQPPTTFDGWFQLVWRQQLINAASIIAQAVVVFLLKQNIMGSDPGFVGLAQNVYWGLLTIFAIASVGIVGLVMWVLPKRVNIDTLLAKEIESPLMLAEKLGHAAIVRSTITSAIAIFGIMLFLFNGEILHFAIFAIVGVLLQLLTLPRRSNWDEVLNIFKMRFPTWRN